MDGYSQTTTGKNNPSMIRAHACKYSLFHLLHERLDLCLVRSNEIGLVFLARLTFLTSFNDLLLELMNLVLRLLRKKDYIISILSWSSTPPPTPPASLHCK